MRLLTAGLNRHGTALWMVCGLAAPASGFADGLPPPVQAQPQAQAQADMQRANPTADAPAAVARLADRAIDFDIPAQPLAEALNRYASFTRRPALFRSEIVIGRTSSAVHGRYLPEDALHRLLEGSGLVAGTVDTGPSDAFVLKEAAAPQTGAGIADLIGSGDYAGLVQARIWEALCDDARTVPGDYRSLLRFQVDVAGRIQGARLLGSTGDGGRDAALLQTLRRVRVGQQPPPAILQQPLTMIVLPDDPAHPADGPRCGKAH